VSLQQLYKTYQLANRICIDSRQLQPNDLFIAIRGKNFNGNAFAREAINKGACFAIIDEKKYADNKQYILVDNTLQTLQSLAKYHRKQFNIPFIGIAGSNGKTTTKELIKSVLRTQYKVFATIGNLNNHIGVPLSLLAIDKEIEIAVIEMGANNFGEIALLCELTAPTHGMITNIGKEHLEGFKDLAGVKKANGELYEYLAQTGGSAFINTDNADLLAMAGVIKKVITYGAGPKADCRGELIEKFPFLKVAFYAEGKPVQISSQLTGTYNFENIIAAISVGSFFKVGMDNIKKAIEGYHPLDNRSQLITNSSNTFILDAYNANPTNMQLALESFSSMPAPHKVVILGDMLEMGEQSYKEHLGIVNQLKNYNFDDILLVGAQFQKVADHIQCKHFADLQQLKQWYSTQKFENTCFMIKGSRKIRLEELLQ